MTLNAACLGHGAFPWPSTLKSPYKCDVRFVTIAAWQIKIKDLQIQLQGFLGAGWVAGAGPVRGEEGEVAPRDLSEDFDDVLGRGFGGGVFEL